jgi:hypothetical protein
MTMPEPGTAVVTKGEPSAKDLGRLRLDLSATERERLERVVRNGPVPTPGHLREAG